MQKPSKYELGADVVKQLDDSTTALTSEAITDVPAHIAYIESGINATSNNMLLKLGLEGNTLKNELNYNPTTWVEWNKSLGVTKDSTGITLTANLSSEYINIPINVKPSTKYGILLFVVSNTMDKNFYGAICGKVVPASAILINTGAVGNIKVVGTTDSTFINNLLTIGMNNAGTGVAKFNAIRLYELPTGSQIETDFTNATTQAQIDALAIKYPFYSGIMSVGGYAGYSATNKIINDINNWSAPSTGTLTLNGSIFTHTANNVGNNPFIQQATSFIVGNKLYARAKARATSSSCTRLDLSTDTQFFAQVTSPIQNQWYTLSGIITNTSGIRFRLFHIYVDAATANGKVMETQEAFVVDLTATFGAGNEPSKEWCDNNLSYFNGTITTTDKIEVSSVSENLFDGQLSVDYTWNASTGTKSSQAGYSCSANLIRVKPNTTYYLSKNGVSANILRVRFYNIDNKYITYEASLVGSFVTPSTAYYLGFHDTTANMAGNIQLEEGSVATTYEPYKQDKIDILISNPLRGLSNGVRDIISSSGVVTRKIGKVVFDGSVDEGWLVGGSVLTNTSCFMVLVTNKVNLTSLCDRFSQYSTIVSTDIEGFAQNGGGMYFRILNSKLATQDVAGFKAWLGANPVTVYYELATPTVEYLNKQLNFVSYPKGTLICNTSTLPANINYKVTGSLKSSTDMLIEDVEYEIRKTDEHIYTPTNHNYYGVTTNSSVNVYNINLTPKLTKLTDGVTIRVKINVDSTGASTINPDGLGAIPIKKHDGTNFTTFKKDGIYTMTYNGSTANFILQGEGTSVTVEGDATAPDLLSGKTATTGAGLITGTMTAHGAKTITPSATQQVFAGGNYTGITVEGDADLITDNIKAGKNIFGVNGKSTVIDTASAGQSIDSNVVANGYKGFVNGLEVVGAVPMVTEIGYNTYDSTSVVDTEYGFQFEQYSDVPFITDVEFNWKILVYGLTPSVLKYGVSVSGSPTGTFTAEATNPITASDVASGKVGFVNGQKITGTGSIGGTGRKSATGTVTSSALMQTLDFTNFEAMTESYNYVDVSGVAGFDFVPKIIIIKKFSSSVTYMTMFDNLLNSEDVGGTSGNIKINEYVGASASTKCSQIVCSGNAYVNSGSFKLPVGLANASYSWYASE